MPTGIFGAKFVFFPLYKEFGPMASAAQVLVLANGICTEYIPKITLIWEDCGFSSGDRQREGIPS